MNREGMVAGNPLDDIGVDTSPSMRTGRIK